jgi:ketosteroid isomerase-like protein
MTDTTVPAFPTPNGGSGIMRKAIRTLLFMTLLVAASASGQDTPAAEPSVSLPPDLARVLTDYEAAWSKKDAAALAGLFAEDGFVLPSGNPPVRGRAAIQKHYTGHGGPLSLRAIAYAAEGRVGYIIGGYTDTAGKPDIGKFTLTLRKGSDGRWLILSDMDNSNRRRGGNETP